MITKLMIADMICVSVSAESRIPIDVNNVASAKAESFFVNNS